VSTSELAVGARLTGEYANETGLTPGVFADASGLLVRSGKLTLQDEFGETVMVASGFSGSWGDYLGMGLYNPLLAGTGSPLSNGRGTQLPYWTISRTGSPVLARVTDSAWPGGSKLKATFTATSDEVVITSDAVAVVPNGWYLTNVAFAWDRSAGSVGFESYIDWYNDAGSLISSSAVGSQSSQLTQALDFLPQEGSTSYHGA
jgi:hypothetical protein